MKQSPAFAWASHANPRLNFHLQLLLRSLSSPLVGVLIAALYVALMTIQRADAGFLSAIAGATARLMIFAWVAGVILLFHRQALPTLCFYAAYIVLGCFLESNNFGGAKSISSWLVLATFLFVLELAIIRAIRPLSPLGQTLFSIAYRVAISSVMLGILCYNLGFHATVSNMTMQALLQTTGSEAREFLTVYGNAASTLGVTVGLLVIIAFAIAQYRVGNPDTPWRRLAALGIVALAQVALLYQPSAIFTTTVGYIYTYHHELAALRQIQEGRGKSLPAIQAHKTARGETYVVVIGESQDRGHLSLYGYDRDTTPWLKNQMCSPEWVAFRRAYSNHTHTVPTLSYALTSANQYNGKDYYSSPSILETAKAAGFRTYWLTNQQGLGEWDNPISAIATAADEYIKINATVGRATDSDYYDSELVERFRRLKPKLNNEKNNLIIFHLMGSHVDYCRRYPSNFNIFGEPENTSIGGMFRKKLGWRDEKAERRRSIDCYDNSIAFTDFVLSKIFSEAQQLPNFRAFVYLPDHADDVAAGLGHDSNRFTFTMSHISLVTWISNALATADPGRVAALKAHVESIWTNDLLYDLLIGIMGIDVDDYNPAYDLSSPRYALSLNNARTLHGEKKISDDPALSSPRSMKISSSQVCNAHAETSSP